MPSVQPAIIENYPLTQPTFQDLQVLDVFIWGETTAVYMKTKADSCIALSGNSGAFGKEYGHILPYLNVTKVKSIKVTVEV